MQRRMFILSLIAVLAVSGAAVWKSTRSVKEPPNYTSVSIGGPFSLVDHNANTVTDADFRGRHLLVFFGYTYCPDVCPTVMQMIGAVLDMLDKEAAKIQPLFITVDPERDTSAVLKSFLENFHPSITGLTGSPEQVKAIAKAYRVYFAKVKEKDDEEDEYLMNHTTGIYLMGSNGKFLTMFSHNSKPENMAARIKKHL